MNRRESRIGRYGKPRRVLEVLTSASATYCQESACLCNCNRLRLVSTFFVGRQAEQGDDMPYANNAGVRIHYEIEGDGPALVLQHGFTQSLEDWAECEYLAPLRPKYRMILVDARGHGGSDKPHDEAAYTLDRRAADVTAVLDAERIEKAHFWGYSMGGWIGFGMAKYAPHRVNALIIGGQHPFA